MSHPLTRHRGAARAAALVVAGGLLLAGGCGKNSGASMADGPSPSETLAPVQTGAVKVVAIDNYFKDDVVTVTAGSKVVWTNTGRNDHNVRATDGGDFAVETKDFHPGASATVTFSTPGTYHYYCTIHGTADKGMTGTIQVVAP